MIQAACKAIENMNNGNNTRWYKQPHIALPLLITIVGFLSSTLGTTFSYAVWRTSIEYRMTRVEDVQKTKVPEYETFKVQIVKEIGELSARQQINQALLERILEELKRQ